MKKDYIIWTPSYSASNGVKVLHLLYKELEKRGYNVSLYSHKPYKDGYNYVEEVSKEQMKNAVVIYPEVVSGNPLKLKNVARYVLYYPGVNGGDKKYHHSEVIFAHRQEFYTDAIILTLKWLNEELFHDDNLPKTQDCYFVYKGGKFRKAKETEGLLEINMDFPETTEELADLLKTTGTMYSYDNCSAILEEATLCGAKVKIITKDGVDEFHSKYLEDTKNTEEQINKFINVTQAMSYIGPIEGKKLSKIKNSLAYTLKYVLWHCIIKDDKKATKYKDRLRGFNYSL